MIDLAGRVALVTGSSRGIGRACALRLAEAGADVVINYITARSAAEDVAAAVLALGRRTAVVKADVGEPDDVAAMMDFVNETFGALDILVSNAATGGFRPLVTTTPRQFEAAMRTNVGALISLMQAALPLLERRGTGAKVIALSSPGARLALPTYGLLGATKAALESLVRHFALEVGDRGINVNAVQAGIVDTDSMRQIPNHEEVLARWQARGLVSGRRLEDRHVADAVVYLASPLSDMIQGQVIVVDAGVLVHV
jgi:enoyl-[acyl-carrier protein] reductase III